MASWRDYYGTRFNPNAQREMFQSGAVPPEAPLSSASESITPIREAGGKIVPAPDTSGLYAIYGRKNPYDAQAEGYMAAARQPGGTGINFAAPVAAFMAGRAMKKSQQFEEQKDADIKNFMARKEAYDAIKNERDTRKANASYLADTIFPSAQQEYLNVLQETKDEKLASSRASDIINKMSSDQGIPAPEVRAFNPWKNATTFAVVNEKGKNSTAIFKDGALKVQDEKGNFVVPDERWLIMKDLANLTRAQKPAGGGSSPAGMLEYYDANGNLVAKTKDQNEALKAGAVYAGMNRVPLSKAKIPQAGQLSNTQRDGLPTPPPAAQQAATVFGRPNPVAGSPGSGQPPAPAPQQPSAQPKQKTRQEAIALLDSQKKPITEANIAWIIANVK